MKDPYQIILNPHVTEKSMTSTADNKYTFVVANDANKIEIRYAVEKIFNVQVLKVNTVSVKGKLGRRYKGAARGHAPDWKKAVVTLAEGSKIELFEGA